MFFDNKKTPNGEDAENPADMGIFDEEAIGIPIYNEEVRMEVDDEKRMSSEDIER